MIFTALLTGNRRDVHSDPKALLTNIEPNEHLDRTHCWVKLTYEVAEMQPKGHQKPQLIQFEADTKEYLKQGTIKQLTLHNIRNIQVL